MTKQEFVKSILPAIQKMVQEAVKREVASAIKNSEFLKTIIHEVAAASVGAALLAETRKPPPDYYHEPLPRQQSSKKSSTERALQEFRRRNELDEEDMKEAKRMVLEKQEILGKKFNIGGMNPFSGTGNRLLEVAGLQDEEDEGEIDTSYYVQKAWNTLTTIPQYEGKQISVESEADAVALVAQARALDPNDPGIPLDIFGRAFKNKRRA